MAKMVSKTELEAIASKQIAPYVDVDGELILKTNDGGSEGYLYSLRVLNSENSGETVIGPHGHAAEFEYYLRGIRAGLDIANGRYADDSEGE